VEIVFITGTDTTVGADITVATDITVAADITVADMSGTTTDMPFIAVGELTGIGS
jgi:hypothetical protein